MLKLTITGNGKTLTLYVAKNAFNGNEQHMRINEQMSILVKLAARMLAKLVADGGNEAIYLAKISFPIESPDDAQAVYYKQSQQYAVKQDKPVTNLRTTEEPSALAFGIKIDNIASDAKELMPLMPVICAQAQPPIDVEDHVVNGLPLQGEEAQAAIKETIRAALKTHNIAERDAEDIIDSFTNNVKETLEQVADDTFGETRLPETEVFREKLSSLNKYISTKSRYIETSITLNHQRINTYLVSREPYFVMSDTLAATLHNAAKDYYLAIWNKPGNRGNVQNLHKEREAFNRLFNGIAAINADFSLTPVQETIDAFRQKNIEETQVLITNLLNNSYVNSSKLNILLNQNMDAIDYIAKRLTDLGSDYCEKITRQATAHKFVLADKCQQTYSDYDNGKNLVSRLPINGRDGLLSIHQDIQAAKAEIQHRASEILNMLPKKLKQRQPGNKKEEARQNNMVANPIPRPSFWQRNKATFISIGLGVLAAGGIAAAIVLTVGTGGIMPFIIAGAAAAAVGISIIVGRVADYFRNRKQKREDAGSAAENASLLENQDNLDSPKTSSRTQREEAKYELPPSPTWARRNLENAAASGTNSDPRTFAVPRQGDSSAQPNQFSEKNNNNGPKL
jgi:hypothetical protein